jgi:tRNA-binding protein
MMNQISWNDFEKVELRTGTIIQVDDFPEAIKPAYKITVDFGAEMGIRKSSAQLTDLYSKEELLGKQIIGIVNFPPKKIGPFVSEFLITGFIQDDKSVVLAVPERKVDNGLKLA